MSWNEFLLIFGMAVVTFGVRYPVLAAFGRIPLPPGVTRGLKYVPPAVLAAIIAPAMLIPGGAQLSVRIDNAYLMAGLAAIIVSWRTRNILATILLGMAAFWIWRLLFPM